MGDVSKIRIITATPQHLREILSLDRDMFKEVDWFSSRQWRNLLKSPNSITLIAYNEKRFAGSTTGLLTKLRNGTTKGRIYSIAVIKAFQRSGVGDLLLKKIEKLLVARGASFITLETRARTGEKRFFEKRGYRTTQSLPDYYVDEDGVRMKKTISQRKNK